MFILGTIPYMTLGEHLLSMVLKELSFLSCTDHQVCSLDNPITPTVLNLYSARIIPFKGAWIEFATDVNNVMYAYIDRKKKFPVTTLLRAIGFESDKDILNFLDLQKKLK